MKFSQYIHDGELQNCINFAVDTITPRDRAWPWPFVYSLKGKRYIRQLLIFFFTIDIFLTVENLQFILKLLSWNHGRWIQCCNSFQNRTVSFGDMRILPVNLDYSLHSTGRRRRRCDRHIDILVRRGHIRNKCLKIHCCSFHPPNDSNNREFTQNISSTSLIDHYSM